MDSVALWACIDVPNLAVSFLAVFRLLGAKAN